MALFALLRVLGFFNKIYNSVQVFPRECNDAMMLMDATRAFKNSIFGKIF
jgi:hypothetical protein